MTVADSRRLTKIQILEHLLKNILKFISIFSTITAQQNTCVNWRLGLFLTVLFGAEGGIRALDLFSLITVTWQVVEENMIVGTSHGVS